MKTNVNEALNINGAEFIGTGNGYDVYKINTYAAAQQFDVPDSNNALAGQKFVQNENTFTQNITNEKPIYFITQANTNHVYGALYKSGESRDVKIISTSSQKEITVSINFEFESGKGTECKTSLPLPFYLVPGLTGEHIQENGILSYDSVNIDALLPQFAPESAEPLDINLIDCRYDLCINGLTENCFTFGRSVNSIRLSPGIFIEACDEAKPAMFNNVLQHIYVDDCTEKPEYFADNWNAGHEAITVYGDNLTDEDKAQMTAEKEEAKRKEEARIAAEKEAKRQEEERKQRELSRRIIYKVEGKNITIAGRRTITNDDNILVIPDTIDGKPVTKIESFAFYNDRKLRNIEIPASVKLIEKGAFAGCVNLSPYNSIHIAKDCIVGKGALFQSNAAFAKSENN